MATTETLERPAPTDPETLRQAAAQESVCRRNGKFDAMEHFLEMGRGEYRFAVPRAGARPVPTLQQVRATAVRKAVELCDGNITLAARLLGVDRNTVYKYTRQMEST